MKRRRSYGAVASHGSGYRRKSHKHVFRLCVVVHRDIGASNARQYNATVATCKGGARMSRGRYAVGIGRTPTAATKKALRAFASKVK